MKKKRKRPSRLEDLVREARKAGAKVSVSLEDSRMPVRLPGDHPHVLLLLDESERMNAMGNRWQEAKCPNLIAADFCLRNGWAMALSAAWLRCKLRGELLPESKDKK